MRYLKNYLAALLSTVLTMQSIPFVSLPASAESAPPLPEQIVTVEQIRSVQDYLLNHNANVKISIDESCDINADGCVDVFDLALLKRRFAAQQKEAVATYNSISELIEENDSIDGQDPDTFHTMRVIVKTDKEQDFSDYHPTAVLPGPDHVYVLQFKSAEQADNCVDALLGSEGIVYVERDDYLEDKAQQSAGKAYEPNSWGVKAIGADAYALFLDATKDDCSVVVAVVDDGVAKHSFIGDRLLPGYDFADNDDDPTPSGSHGTHVAGTVVDCMPSLNVKILPVRVFGEGNNGASSLTVGNAIRYAVDHGANVVNLSLGGKGCSHYLDDAIEYAIANDVTVVTSAGNNSENTAEYCPAHLRECIVVAASDSKNQPASFTNFGNSVDVIAPGVDILSCVPGEKYESFGGTSMSAPHVSAAAAMMKIAYPKMSPAEIEELLKKTCLDLGDAGWDPIFGSGLPQLQVLGNVHEITPKISISESSAELAVDHLLQITATPYPKILDVTWHSSDPSVATVEDGAVRAIAFGTATITATVTNGGKKVSASCKVTVTDKSSTILDSGTCGEAITYTLDGNGLLTLHGTGATDYYSSAGNTKLVRDGVVCPESPLAGNDQIYSIKVEEGITALNDGLFNNCSSLYKVELPASLTAINNAVFGGCTALEEICLPANLKTIGGTSQIAYEVFGNCTALQKITVDPENPYFSDDDGVLLSKDGTTLYFIPNARTDYVVKDGIQTLHFGCAYQHTELCELILPQSVTTIHDRAFMGCSNLSTVALGDGVKIIGQYAFSETGLTKVSIPSSVMDIGSFAFGTCQLQRVIFETQGTLPLRVSADAFNENSELDQISFPPRTSEIASSLMASDTPRATLYNTATRIAKDAFRSKTVLIGYGGSTAEAFAAENGMQFENLDPAYKPKTGGFFGKGYAWTLNEDGSLYISLTGDMLAYEEINYTPLAPWAVVSSEVKTVELNKKATSICDGAFCNMPSLSSIEIPDSITRIGSDVFSGSGIKELTIPASVEKINENAFRGADQLEKITFLSDHFSWDYRMELKDTLPKDIVIYGRSGSTAEKYANKFHHTFVPIE
ncbi:MAG: leucine-rich repeat protein [Oscillospiraceae bacterium]|nr:leucine-rich repeat protein [Oscillospiraceae bacterium]